MKPWTEARRTNFEGPEGDRSPVVVRGCVRRECGSKGSMVVLEGFRGGDAWPGPSSAAGEETGTVELDIMVIGRKLRDEVVVVYCDGNEASECRKIDEVCRRREGRRVIMYL